MPTDFSDIHNAIDRAKREISRKRVVLESIRDDAIIPQLHNIFDTSGLGQWQPAVSSDNALLIDSGTLLNSLTSPNSGSFTIGNDYLEVRHSVSYGDFHEDGTGYLPQREIIGLLDENDPAITNIIQGWISVIESIVERF